MVIPYYREVRRCENEAPKKSRYKCAVKTSGFSLVKHQNGIDGPTKKCSLAIVVFIAQLVRALHRNLKGHGFHSRWSLKVFSDSLCVNKLDDNDIIHRERNKLCLHNRCIWRFKYFGFIQVKDYFPSCIPAYDANDKQNFMNYLKFFLYCRIHNLNILWLNGIFFMTGSLF